MKLLYKCFLLFLFIPWTFLQLDGQSMIDTNSLKKAMVTNEKDINTEYIEFSPSIYNDYIMYIKSNKDGDWDDNMDDYFLDIVFAAKNNNGFLTKSAFLPETVNSEMHEGQAAFDNINNKLFFTRSFYNKGKGTARDTVRLKIYEASKNNNFATVRQLPFNDEKFNTCHPTLNRSADRMIFSSNKSGSSKMDLYSVRKEGSSWGEPTLLEVVNSEFNEIAPYLYKDSLLIFSSDRAESLGGMDLFYSMTTDTGWSLPRPLPYPINSSFDDIGIALNDKGNTGYFSSNRPGGKGKDDIYRFETNGSFIKKENKVINSICTVSVIDKLTFLPIEKATITISEIDISQSTLNKEIAKGQKEGELIMKFNDNGKLLYKLITNKDGNVESNLTSEKTYLVKLNTEGYEEQILFYNPSSFGNDLTIVATPASKIEIEEKPKDGKLIIPTNVGAVVVFNNIYYEYGSAAIKQDAAFELELLASTMLSNPTMRIQLSSHTDSRGTTIYNKNLSAQRAQSAKDFLTKKGIEPSRIVSIGFGESRIRNACSDGVKCSEEEHLFNRRTEVLVIE